MYHQKTCGIHQQENKDYNDFMDISYFTRWSKFTQAFDGQSSSWALFKESKENQYLLASWSITVLQPFKYLLFHYCIGILVSEFTFMFNHSDWLHFLVWVSEQSITFLHWHSLISPRIAAQAWPWCETHHGTHGSGQQKEGNHTALTRLLLIRLLSFYGFWLWV